MTKLNQQPDEETRIKRTYYIDVGNLPADKAAEIIDMIMQSTKAKKCE